MIHESIAHKALIDDRIDVLYSKLGLSRSTTDFEILPLFEKIVEELEKLESKLAWPIR